MDALETFSIYNAARVSTVDPNPLSFLNGDGDHGWQVARNLLKPLNHLDFLRRKEAIAEQLALHNTRTPAEVFNAGYRLLEEHQQGRLSTATVIDQLAAPLSQGAGGIKTLLQEYATIRHMEFHPTDLCNLSCKECTYGHDDFRTKPAPVHYPFEALHKVFDLKPRSMVIIGGGEPTLYRSGGHGFQDVVDELTTADPGVRLALVTNGTNRPAGNWPSKFSWIRISLDAATAETYRRFRGQPLFDKVIKTFLSYLDEDVPYVGISFLYARSNIHEYARVADFIFKLVSREKPRRLRKVNIQYRPLRRDPNHPDGPFREAISAEQIQAAAREVIDLAESSPEMERFLREQTNITAVLGGNTHPAYEFSRCYYSQTFKIVRANGDIRPCFIRVTEPDFLLGNLLTSPLEAIGLNTLYAGAKRKANCSPSGCRQCHVNYIFENGLAGKIQPSTSEEVLADPMY